MDKDYKEMSRDELLKQLVVKDLKIAFFEQALFEISVGYKLAKIVDSQDLLAL